MICREPHSDPWGTDPFPGVDSDGSVWGTEVGWGYQHPDLEKEFVASSLETGNTGLSQPPQGTLVSPQGDEER